MVINLDKLYDYKLEQAKQMVKDQIFTSFETHRATGSIWMVNAKGDKDLFWSYTQEIDGIPDPLVKD
jgi:hypothetical protein